MYIICIRNVQDIRINIFKFGTAHADGHRLLRNYIFLLFLLEAIEQNSTISWSTWLLFHICIIENMQMITNCSLESCVPPFYLCIYPVHSSEIKETREELPSYYALWKKGFEIGNSLECFLEWLLNSSPSLFMDTQNNLRKGYAISLTAQHNCFWLNLLFIWQNVYIHI